MPGSVGLDHRHMTLRHAAMKTGLSATTLRHYIKAGRLRARLIPGRYGLEYVVDDGDLRMAELFVDRPADRRMGTAHGDSGAAASDAEPPAPPLPALAEPAPPPAPLFTGDIVPGLLYRELMMKHEHLLVQFGMLRVSGQQVFELRQDAQRRESEARRIVEELAQTRARHAREIGGLKAKLRQAELDIAAHDDENQALRAEIRRLEVALRNATTAGAMDEQFARQISRPPLEDN